MDALGTPVKTVPPADCLDAALELLDRGFSIIPIRPGEKRPPERWPWKEFQSRQPTPEEVEAWFTRWPGANLALVTGSVSGVWAMDADGPAGEAWLRANLPTTGIYSRTPRGGCHAIYALPAGVTMENGVKVGPELDVRGEGGYILVPPSVVNGVAYRWEFTPGLDGWDDLAEYAWSPKVVSLEARREGNLNLDLSLAPDPASRLSLVLQGGRNNALAVKAGRWFGLGMDLDEVMLTATSWNQRLCSPPLGEKELKATVRSVWRTHQRNHPPIDPDPDALAEAPPEVADAAASDVPDTVLHPGGLLGQTMEYIEAASAASHPLFNLAAAITLLGATAGQRVMTETGLRTNFYCVCLGYSGSGKDAPHSAIEALLGRPSLAKLLGPNDPTSAAAILHWLKLEGQQSALLRLDEVGFLLRAARDTRSPAHQIPGMLMQLFSATDRGYSKSYAGADPIKLWWHHVCLYGSSTPLRFWESLTSSEVVDGFLARLLLFESRHPASLPKTGVWFPDPPEFLVASLERIHAIPVPTVGAGNLAQRPEPLVVGKNNAALEAFRPWALAYHERRNDARERNPTASAIYGRAGEHASKLALVHALSRHGHLAPDEAVDAQDVAWACALVDHLVETAIRGVVENVADNDWHRLEQRVLAIVRAGRTVERPGLTAREIGRRMHQPNRVLKDLLDSMVSHGLLVVETIKPSRGRAASLFIPATLQHTERMCRNGL